MNQFSVFFLTVSIFAFNVAVCMNPTDLGLPPPLPPANVEFGECFVVPEIKSAALTTQLYEYHHICPKQLPNDGSEQGKKVWYAVGSLITVGAFVSIMDRYDYVEIEQPQIKFTFLKDTSVEFVIGTTNLEFKITFQSFEQSQAFYGRTYQDVVLTQTVTIFKIGMLHEMMDENIIKMGTDVETFHEDINGILYFTFKNELGKPLVIFSQREAKIARSNRSRNTMLQILLRIRTTDYILTFSCRPEARIFNDFLFVHVQSLRLARISPDVRERFINNQITVDPQHP